MFLLVHLLNCLFINFLKKLLLFINLWFAKTWCAKNLGTRWGTQENRKKTKTDWSDLVNPAKNPCTVNPFPCGNFPGFPRIQQVCMTWHDFPRLCHDFPRFCTTFHKFLTLHFPTSTRFFWDLPSNPQANRSHTLLLAKLILSPSCREPHTALLRINLVSNKLWLRTWCQFASPQFNFGSSQTSLF